MHGLTIPQADRSEMVPAKKPTQFMGNGYLILSELSNKCDKTHAHQPLVGGRASKALEYSYELCHAMIRGLSKQKANDGSGKARTGTMRRSALMLLIASVRSCQKPSSEYGNILFSARYLGSEHAEDRQASQTHGANVSLTRRGPSSVCHQHHE